MPKPTDPALRALVESTDPIASLEALALETFRETPQRRTFRFEVDGRSYFAKVHRGWEWKGALSELLRGLKPAPGARDEARVLDRLAGLGIPAPKVVAADDLGGRVLGRRSYLITEDVGTQTTLDELWSEERWSQLAASVRNSLADQAGRIAGAMHAAGINHRDLYLVHLHVELEVDPPRVVLLDLHRAQERRRVPRRWLVKDLAGLLATASVIRRPSRAVLARFVRAYAGGSLRGTLAANASLWSAVRARAERDLGRLGQ